MVSRCWSEVLPEEAMFFVRRFGSTAERQMPRMSANSSSGFWTMRPK